MDPTVVGWSQESRKGTIVDDIDFTKWTDAQLHVGLKYDDSGKIQAELDRRGGTDDGSEARVAALLASSRRRTRRER